jgi:hypothetical protein
MKRKWNEKLERKTSRTTSRFLCLPIHIRVQDADMIRHRVDDGISGNGSDMVRRKASQAGGVLNVRRRTRDATPRRRWAISEVGRWPTGTEN